MLLFLIGVALLFAVSLLAVGVGKAIALGNDYDAPQHVNTRDWAKVTHLAHTPGFARRVK